MGCTTPFQIRYTIDDSDPANSSTSVRYARPFVVTDSCVIRAVGLATAIVQQQQQQQQQGDGGGGGGGSVAPLPPVPPRFAESQSVLVRRPIPTELVSGTSITILMKSITLDIAAAPLLWNFGDDNAYRQQPMVNKSWIGQPLAFRAQTFASGLGLKAPMHLNWNLTTVRAALHPGALSHFAVAAAIDGGCDKGNAYSPGFPLPGFNHVYNCHDIAEWQHARVKLFLDGQAVSESPVLQSQGLEWIFNISIPPASEVLRLVAMPAEKDDDGGVAFGSFDVVQQNAYDWVDLVGGFA